MKNLFILDGFKDATCDLIFTGENEQSELFDIRIDIHQIAEFLSIEGKRINLIDGSDDIMEAARQMYDGFTNRPTSYDIEIKKQKVFKSLQVK
jgi:hypothetical protein